MSTLEQTAKVVGQARKLRGSGDREGAKAVLLSELERIREERNHFLACYLTHDLAHAEEDPQDQLLWHLEALGYADSADDERVRGSIPPYTPTLAIPISDWATLISLAGIWKALMRSVECCQTTIMATRSRVG